MKLLVIGSGAREHALVWKLAQSPKVDRVYVAPGNGGTSRIASNLDIKATDKESLAKAIKKEGIGLVVVGPEDPLAEGIVDYFENIGVPIFGPSQAAAQLEASKAFSKALFQKYAIPCAQSQTFADLKTAEEYILKQNSPLVVKADGLAAGKGVIMAETRAEALAAVSSILQDKSFGSAGSKVIIEEWLKGKEMSFFAVTDGECVLPLAPACDYKRIDDGDRGLNTGGMGSYSPPYFYTTGLGEKVMQTIIKPTTEAMRSEKRPYRGILYAGLMLEPQSNQPKVLEYNVRFGDPECQVILPRLKSDLVDIILGVINGNLAKVKLEWSEGVCVGVALASQGYPVKYRTGLPISGLDNIDRDILVFHAGTRLDPSGRIVTNGGRVLTVVASGKSVGDARDKIYANIPRIHFEGCHYRKDIALFKT